MYIFLNLYFACIMYYAWHIRNKIMNFNKNNLKINDDLYLTKIHEILIAFISCEIQCTFIL